MLRRKPDAEPSPVRERARFFLARRMSSELRYWLATPVPATGGGSLNVARKLMLWAIWIMALSLAPLIVIAKAPSPALKALSLVALVWYSNRRLREYKGDKLRWSGDWIEAVALLLIGMSFDDPFAAIGIFYAGLLFRSLYGSGRRVVEITILYFTAHVGSVIALGAFDPQIVNQMTGFASMAGIMHWLSISLVQEEQARTREKIVMKTSADLVASLRLESIYKVLVEAVWALAERAPDARVSLAVGTPAQMTVVAASGAEVDHVVGSTVDDLGVPELMRPVSVGEVPNPPAHHDSAIMEPAPATRPQAGTLFVAPVQIGGEHRGTIVLASDSLLPTAVGDGVRAIASLAALAFENVSMMERRSEDRFQALVQQSTDIITVVHSNGVIEYQSPSIDRVLGLDHAELVGKSFSELVHPKDRPMLVQLLMRCIAEPEEPTAIECRLAHRDGSWRYWEVVATNLLDNPSIEGVLLNARDVTSRKALEERLAHEALHDPLTDLANRELFEDRLKHSLMRAARSGEPVAVLYMDLDKFKTVNDSLGHSAGDDLLRSVADRIKLCLRAPDTAARMGGDEFAVLLEGASRGNAVAVAERILSELRKPLLVNGIEVLATASVGIALGLAGEDAALLMGNADIALYESKDRGRGRYEVFEPFMRSGKDRRLELQTDLGRAIEEDQLLLHYQPIFRLDPLEVVGVEALVRWQHPEKGLIPPGDFIPLAEDSGLIVALGRKVLDMACKQGAAWELSLQRSDPLRIGVNVSGRQLQDPSLMGDVAEALASSGLDSETLVLEITESTLVHDPEETAKRLHELRKLGVNIAIDDFGTGYSSLSRLRHFPITVFKVDRSFVRGIDRGIEESAYARAIVRLGVGLGLDVVAEGIETEGELQKLRESGCQFGQGFLLARPAPSEQLHELLMGTPAAVPATLTPG